jgi:chromosome segregation ATPase
MENITPTKRKRCSMGPEASLAFSLQALFERHEAYAADAEKERARLQEEVDSLKSVNTRLEEKNNGLLKENGELKVKLATRHKVTTSDAGLDTRTVGSTGG